MSAGKGAAHQTDGGEGPVGSGPTVPAGSDIAALLAPLVGVDIPGGCDECPDPYQTVERLHGVWLLTVHHDDHCPRLARYRRGGAA